MALTGHVEGTAGPHAALEDRPSEDTARDYEWVPFVRHGPRLNARSENLIFHEWDVNCDPQGTSALPHLEGCFVQLRHGMETGGFRRRRFVGRWPIGFH